jgi:hypothetical protein
MDATRQQYNHYNPLKKNEEQDTKEEEKTIIKIREQKSKSTVRK